ncbi:Hypothetical predicted protein [Paramuricea clavata]|uniref:Uncharacterized protein n=1 Tax=Paramuricea clavata TaxID=317549 RepID=A0A7D9EB97_PARCT|nr:Hypothetical predicted protein [Paramuricea clavata]
MSDLNLKVKNLENEKNSLVTVIKIIQNDQEQQQASWNVVNNRKNTTEGRNTSAHNPVDDSESDSNNVSDNGSDDITATQSQNKTNDTKETDTLKKIHRKSKKQIYLKTRSTTALLLPFWTNTSEKAYVLYVGRNDLQTKSPDTLIMAISRLGETITQEGNGNELTLSEVISRNDNANLADKVNVFNKKLDELCTEHNWGLIKHDYITKVHLNNYGLHLNQRGTSTLAGNVKQFLKNQVFD